MAKKKLFGNDIKPKCEYCIHGKLNSTGDKVGCDKKGLVNADFSCKQFTYSPLKRIPAKQHTLSAEAAEAAAKKAEQANAAAEEKAKEAQEENEAAKEAVEESAEETVEETTDENPDENADVSADESDSE